MRNAFSLVELSIVLVILGLLTGGILAGQSLIRAAELRAVGTEYDRYLAASHTFRDKYMAIPGDMPNATRFWGDNNSLCADAAIPNGTPGTCNGNGNGLLAGASGASATGEMFAYWQHLALAGLIEGSYSGAAGTGSAVHCLVGVNCPASRISSTGWGVYSWGIQSASAELFDGSYGLNLAFGKENPSNRPIDAVLKPEELWNIDIKLDDGKPATGRVSPRARVGCTLTAAGAAITTSAADATLMDAIYNLPNTSTVCAVIFRNIY